MGRNCNIFGSLAALWPVWAIIAATVVFFLATGWCEQLATEDIYTPATVLRADFIPSYKCDERSPWGWGGGWGSGGAVETYMTTISCDDGEANITLSSSRQDIYGQARTKINRSVVARISKLNRYLFVSPIKGVDYKYAIVSIE